MISLQSPRRLLFVLSVLFTRPVTAFRTPALSDELGCSPTLSSILRTDSFFFDPLELATDENFGRMREAELKHGRVAMLAVSHTVAIPLLKLTTDWVPKTAPEGVITPLRSISLGDWIKFVFLCGFLELFVFVQRKKKDMPGDYGYGYFGVRDKGQNERRLVVELENGRLAMIAVVGQIAGELASGGKAWDEQWFAILRDWAVGEFSLSATA